MIQGRVNGIISLTRSLGDHNMKEWIINDPFYSEMTISSKDKFLILACDGVRKFSIFFFFLNFF